MQLRRSERSLVLHTHSTHMHCTDQVVVELVGLRLVGAACKPGGAGTTVTIPVNSTGATAVVWCAEQAVQ